MIIMLVLIVSVPVHCLYLFLCLQGTFSVVLSFKPKMVQKDLEKQEDIYKFGKLMDTFLKRCKVPAVKSV